MKNVSSVRYRYVIRLKMLKENTDENKKKYEEVIYRNKKSNFWENIMKKI